MGAISATNSATPSLQLALGRNRLEQARRDADQAEINAKDLRNQANKAEQEAQKSQENVREQAARNQQLDSTYDSQLKSSTAVVPLKTQEFLVGLYNATSANRAASGNPLKAKAAPASVLNSQGQATGRIVNVSA